MKRSEIQAVFFDFDGVLVDSTPVKTAAFVEMFAPYGSQIVKEVVDYHRQHGGISRVEKIRLAHENFIGVSLAPEELERWARNYAKLVVDEVVAAKWIPGAWRFLEDNYQRLPLFVVSGTPEPELREVVERRGMNRYFKEILGSPTGKVDHIHTVLRSYHLEADRCFFVGDALTDYRAARQTGLRFIGIQKEVEFPADTTVLPDCSALQRLVFGDHEGEE